MLIADFVAHFGDGNYAKASRRIGKTRTAALKWKEKGEYVPVDVALLASALSGGALPFDKEHYQAELLAKFNAN